MPPSPYHMICTKKTRIGNYQISLEDYFDIDEGLSTTKVRSLDEIIKVIKKNTS